MVDTTLLEIIKRSAPLLGEVVGSVSPLAGMALSLIARLFGFNADVDPAKLTQAIQNDPDHDIKLKTLQVQHADALLDAQTQIRLAAYQREQHIAELTGKRDWVMDVLALFTVGSYFAIATLIFFVKADPSMNGIINFMCGELSTAAAMVLAYFFGASFTPKFFRKNAGDIQLPPPAQTR